MKTFHGTCHCGAVVFDVDAAVERFTRCDCSLCAMRNSVMTRVHQDNLRILKGEDVLTLYQWNTNVAQHQFCSQCGIYVFHRKRALPDHYEVNVHCLHDLDRTQIPIVQLDGVSMSLVADGAAPHWPGPRD